MKKLAFFVPVFLLIGFSSCVKDHTAFQPTTNYRLESIQLLSSVNGSLPTRELYNFYYDNSNRVSHYIYSIDINPTQDVSVFYTYSPESNKIYKNYYSLTDTLLERSDSFATNFNGQIIEAWTPTNHFQYLYNGRQMYEMVSIPYGNTMFSTTNDNFFRSVSTISYDSNMTYKFYETLLDRTGDYLQLGSFIFCGMNLFQNADLIRSSVSSGYTNEYSYIIDANSKITQTTAVITDSVGNVYNYTYNLAYESY